ncbi:MAG: GNAT family N-acetyltransferase [Lachnospiraceae bacterium]|nr:GNAT family N-acetyltransferase [Lachnospiraceae bacterium]
MFKRAAFILKKENAQSDIHALIDDLTANKIDSCIENVDNILKDNINHTEKNVGLPDTLFITDNAACQMILKSNKLPVIVYLHEKNTNEIFSHAEYAIEQIEEVEYESLKLAYLRLTGQPWTILTTDRCEVRETTAEDADSFYEIYKEPSITRYMEDLYNDKAAEVAYIQDYIRNVYAFYGYGMWTVLEKSSGKVIGRAGISWREGFDIPELGFVIAVPYQHQGYAYEVCNAILEYGKTELGFTCIQALVMEENESSKSLCRKLGFKYSSKVVVDNVQYNRLTWESV